MSCGAFAKVLALLSTGSGMTGALRSPGELWELPRVGSHHKRFWTLQKRAVKGEFGRQMCVWVRVPVKRGT